MKIEHIFRLLECLAEKTDQSLDTRGFNVMSDKIDDHVYISARYLIELHRRLKKERDEGAETTTASAIKIDTIARYLEYKDFVHFSLSLESRISAVMLSCAGNWWSYVRSSSGNAIYQAPVRIFEDKKKSVMRLDMKGRERTFSGKIEEKAGCLTGFLESGTDKCLGLVFKIGDSRNMNVLQGVFCGMSTAGLPIAGKELLIREKVLEYENMEWSGHELDDGMDHKIKNYFSDMHASCLGISGVSGFELEDLK